MNDKSYEGLLENGYSNIREIEGRGTCGVMRFLFTVGLCYGLDEWGYKGRYCFPSKSEAIEALNSWDGNGDPSGDWIKHKGEIEYANPNKLTTND